MAAVWRRGVVVHDALGPAEPHACGSVACAALRGDLTSSRYQGSLVSSCLSFFSAASMASGSTWAFFAKSMARRRRSTSTGTRPKLRRLRAVNADGPKALQPMALWRGMRDVAELPALFLESGGTELAFMSSTTRLQVWTLDPGPWTQPRSLWQVALEYALLRGARDGAVVSHCLLLKMTTRTFIERGADLAYLSCYPSEAEVLFPPLTYLRPTGRATKLTSEELRAEVGAEADPSSHSHTKEALEQLAWPSITAVEVELVIP